MIEWIIAIAAGYAIGCLVAFTIMYGAIFSERGIKWLYHRSKTIMEVIMKEEEAKLKGEEDYED